MFLNEYLKHVLYIIRLVIGQKGDTRPIIITTKDNI